MKKATLKNLLFILTLCFASVLSAQDNQVTIDPTPGGSEGNAKFDDEMTITVSAAGVVSLPAVAGVDWEIDPNSTGDITLAGAQDKTFVIKWKGVATTNTTEGADFGALLTSGGIDRASNGDLGIRAGAANGIEPGEGYIFGFDLANLTSDVTLQITGVSFSGITASTGEEATIVNRSDTSKRLVTQANGNNNISDLDVFITGGDAKLNILSVFHSGNPTGFRINGLTFKIRETATLSTENISKDLSSLFSLAQNPVTDVIIVKYNANEVGNYTAQLIDTNGRIVQEKNAKKSSLNNLSFDAKNLASGLYFVKVNSNGKSTTLKVLKN